MKRKLPFYLALVLSGVPAAFANTPVVYGKLNITLDQLDNEGAALWTAGAAVRETDQWELNSNASRLGVKGELPLENTGVSVVYQVEYETNADDGSSSASSSPITQRNTFAGLQGGFGRLIGGKFDTPLKAAEGRVDLFNDLRADIDALIGGQNRADNIVQYATPKLAELVTLNLAFITPEGADVDQDGQPDDGLADTYSASIVADNGTFYGALAYESNQVARRGLDLRNAPVGVPPVAPNPRADILRLVGVAKLGPFELGALWQQASAVADGSDLEDSSYLLSAGWNISKTKLKAQYGLSEGDVTEEEGSLLAVGADYSLGNKTKVFTYLSSLDLDETDVSDETFAIGLDHNF